MGQVQALNPDSPIFLFIKNTIVDAAIAYFGWYFENCFLLVSLKLNRSLGEGTVEVLDIAFNLIVKNRLLSTFQFSKHLYGMNVFYFTLSIE